MSTSDLRYRADFKEVSTLYNDTVNGAPGGYASVFKRWNAYHWMADQINPFNHMINRRAPGYCQHLKVDATFHLGTLVWHNGSTTIIEDNPDHWSAVQLPGQSPTGSPTDPDDFGVANFMQDFFKTNRFKDLCFEAWTKLKTQVPPEVSLLNFLYELKDFKELGKSLAKIPNSLRKHSVPFVTNLKGRGKVRKGAKAVNDSFLSYNFQWAPFVGDLIKLTKLADNVAARLDFLRRTRGKEVTIRFNKPDCFINSQLDVDQEKGWQNNDWRRTFKLTKYQCDFNVTAKLMQNLQGLDDAWAGLKATFAALGMNNPAKVIWNAIPFSFLLDWIAPFGKWLERAAQQPFSGTWDVYDITTSVRERGEIEFNLQDRGQSGVVCPKTTITRWTVDRYLRLVGLPQTLSGVDFSQLTQQQQKLFLSLVLTKVL